MNPAAMVSIILCPRLLGLMLPLLPHWHLNKKKMKTDKKKVEEIGLVSQEKIRKKVRKIVVRCHYTARDLNFNERATSAYLQFTCFLRNRKYVVGGRKLRNEKLHNFYSSSSLSK